MTPSTPPTSDMASVSGLEGTPAPWLVHPERAWVSPATDMEMPVCCLRWPAADLTEKGVYADARLIAAAPELFEALERLERAIAIDWSGVAGMDEFMDAHETVEDAREFARAALAKARGES